jgi:hypothetical protein
VTARLEHGTHTGGVRAAHPAAQARRVVQEPGAEPPGRQQRQGARQPVQRHPRPPAEAQAHRPRGGAARQLQAHRPQIGGAALCRAGVGVIYISVGSAHAPTRAPAASLWHHSCDLLAWRRSSCVGPPHLYTHAAYMHRQMVYTGSVGSAHAPTCTGPSGVAVAPFVRFACTAPLVVRGPSALVHACCIGKNIV